MKFLSSRSACTGALLAFLALVGCGGGSTVASYSLSGTVSGLAIPRSLVLQNAGERVTVTADGNFSFPTAVPSGSSYSASIETQPQGQACALANASGTVRTAVTNLTVTCANKPGRFVFVTNFYDGTISALSITAGTGLLQSIGTAVAGMSPWAIAVTPDGRYAYATNLGDNTISGFAINSSSGALSALSGSATATGGTPYGLAIEPVGQYLYVANSTDSTLSGYRIDAGSGALTTIFTPIATGQIPTVVAADPSGAFLYVAYGGAPPGITIYAINRSNGSLSAVGTYSTNAETTQGIAMAPSGGQLVLLTVTSANEARMQTLAINGSTGTLSPLGTSLVSSYTPASITMSPSGNAVFVADNQGNTFSRYALDRTTGVLTLVGTMASAGGEPADLAVDPGGTFLYMTNQTDGTVSAYSVTGNGMPTSLGANTSSGNRASRITITY